MSLLSVKDRQYALKYLGFYKGDVDGKVGPLTKQAYIDLQACYFVREEDIDGKYGKNTDILLHNAFLVKMYAPDFKLSEFKCGCGRKYCTGYPVKLSLLVLSTLQKIRNKYGRTIITSGLRCKKHNSSLVGSSKSSKHLKGLAVDFKGDFTKSSSQRYNVKRWINENIKPKVNYIYFNKNHMGTAIHIDFKKDTLKDLI